MSGLSLRVCIGMLNMEAVQEHFEPGGEGSTRVYEVDRFGQNLLHAFVSTCCSHARANRMSPNSEETKAAQSIFTELAVRLVNPHQKTDRDGHTPRTLAELYSPAIPSWIIDVLSFYEKYYDAKYSGEYDPQMVPGTTNPIALEVIGEIKRRANEFSFEEVQQLQEAQRTRQSQTTATPPAALPNFTLSSPLLPTAPCIRRRMGQTTDTNVLGSALGPASVISGFRI